MNFNFNIKDSPLRRRRQSSTSQSPLIGVTWRNSAPEMLLGAAKQVAEKSMASGQIRRRYDAEDVMSASLPDPHPVLWSKVKLIGGLYVECRVPGVDVSHRGSTKLSRGMPVRHDLLAKRGIPRLRSPVLAEGYKELLIAGQP